MLRRLAVMGAVVGAVCVPASAFAIGTIFDPDIHYRGDANSDERIDLSDVTTINNFLFMGGAPPPCMNQADVDNDGTVQMTDSVYLSNWLYNGGPPPPPVYFPPGSDCGVDDTPTGCKISPCD